MSNQVGPICHIPPATTIGDPQPKNLPGLPGPAGPDMNSILNLVNALRQTVLQLANQLDNLHPGVINDFTTKHDPSKKTNWVEINRTTKKVRVYQNNDKSSPNYVDVEQINSLRMGNKRTGEQWLWQRDHGG